jgi:uncharacterized protein (TIGR00299 family) protein
MLLAALLDLDPSGSAETLLLKTVAALGLGDVRLRVWREASAGLMCTRVEVSAPSQAPLRTLADLRAVIERSSLGAELKERSLAALERLAAVEAGLHGVDVEEVHFHEIGAVDTVVDVVGGLALVEALAVECIEHGPVPVGSGSVETSHGRLGVPAPATLALLKGAKLMSGPEKREVTTPTGALLLTEMGAVSAPLPHMVVEAVGYGGGAAKLEHGPNVLRVIQGRDETAACDGPEGGGEERPRFDAETVVLLEAAIDDATPEVLAYVQERLLAKGALDAWWTPVSMKKGRIGSQLTVVCRATDEAHLVDTVFRESTTLGVRRSQHVRYVLRRDVLSVDVRGERVQVKVGHLGEEVCTVAPEFDDARRAAIHLGIPLKDVMAEAAEAARRQMSA